MSNLRNGHVAVSNLVVQTHSNGAGTNLQRRHETRLLTPYDYHTSNVNTPARFIHNVKSTEA